MQNNSLWRSFSLWFQSSQFLPPFILCWLTSIIVSQFIPYTSLLNFIIILGIVMVNLHFVHKFTKEEVDKAHKEFLENPEYKLLDELLLKLRAGGNVSREDIERVIAPKEGVANDKDTPSD